MLGIENRFLGRLTCSVISIVTELNRRQRQTESEMVTSVVYPEPSAVGLPIRVDRRRLEGSGDL